MGIAASPRRRFTYARDNGVCAANEVAIHRQLAQYTGRIAASEPMRRPRSGMCPPVAWLGHHECDGDN